MRVAARRSHGRLGSVPRDRNASSVWRCNRRSMGTNIVAKAYVDAISIPMPSFDLAATSIIRPATFNMTKLTTTNRKCRATTPCSAMPGRVRTAPPHAASGKPQRAMSDTRAEFPSPTEPPIPTTNTPADVRGQPVSACSFS